jgi:Xaa-Pro aminopeptidase
MKERISKVREMLAETGAEALFVVHPPNVRYLTGFTGSNGTVVISGDEAHFFTDFRYQEQSREQVAEEYEIHVVKDVVKEAEAPLGKVRKAGFESGYLTYDAFRKLKEALDSVELVPLGAPVSRMRSIKTESEVKAIQSALQITEEVLMETLELVTPGKTREIDLDAEIKYRFTRRGALEGFPTIVQTGPRSALPHGAPGDRVVEADAMLLFDMGARVDGYSADLTRTFWVGNRPDEKFKKIYDVVRFAVAQSEAHARPGMSGKELDSIARTLIKKEGFGEYFGHGLGHGVGLEVHETPKVAATSTDVLQTGAVFTIEPGIYLPEYGGVRIEDMVVLREDGCEVLTGLTKDLTQI